MSLDAFGNRVIRGEELAEKVRHAASFPSRDAAAPLERFLQNDPQGSFCFLYGLPGTGRRTMLMRALASSDPEALSRTAWVQCPHWAGDIDLARAADAAVQSGATCIVLDGPGDVPQIHLDSKLLGGMLWRKLHVVLSCALPLQAAIRAS
ncbi:MAG: hypothetical protein IK061_00935, partial [Desulfovibrio sp.]|nr:hypothetical protein [Desulfovibrio sp.]